MLKVLFIREIQIKTIMRYHLTPAECPSSESLQVTNAGECVKKENPPTLLVGMKVGMTTMENNMEVP